MSNFTIPLCLEPRFSKRFTLVLMVTHGGALLLLIPLALPFTHKITLIVKLCIGLLVLESALYTTHQHLLLINHPLYGCILHYDENRNGIRVQLKSGQEAQIAYSSYTHPQLVVLKIKGKLDALIIFPDALDIQTFRLVRVHLQHVNNPNNGK